MNFKTLIRKDVGLELNTAGYKYGLGHPNPTEAILKRYAELGGEILTIGCDGHARAAGLILRKFRLS